MSAKPTVAVFDTKPYDREYLTKSPGSEAIEWLFLEVRLDARTARAAENALAVCIFVNDDCQRDTLQQLARAGVKHVALRCAGFNNVDLKAARELGITVSRVPSYSPHAVAEHTIALILALNRKIHRAFNRVRELNFSLSGLVGFDMHGKTVGVVGTGKIGRIAAEILHGFGMKVLAYDVYPDPAWAAARCVEYVDLETLFRESDIVSLHTPLTKETEHLIRAETLALMKPGVVIVNVSRGGLIDTAALIESLKTGHVSGVALDVYEEEEGVFFEDLSGTLLQDDVLARLLTFPNVLITAHQAFLTEEALGEISRVTIENLRRISVQEAFLEGTQV